MEKENGRDLAMKDIHRLDRPKVPEGQRMGDKRVRTLSEWLREQDPAHEIRQFKIVGTGADDGKCLIGYKNMATKKTLVTEIRAATLEEKLMHGVKKWGRKFKGLANE